MPNAKSACKLALGGALLFGGAALGTYLANLPRQPSQQLSSQSSYQSHEQAKPGQAQAISSPEDAIKLLENRERAREAAAKQAELAARQAELTEYHKLKKDYQTSLSRHLLSKIDAGNRLELEAANCVLSLLGLDEPLNYAVLDKGAPAVQILVHDIAVSLYSSHNLSVLREQALKTGQKAPPSEDELKLELKKYKAALKARLDAKPPGSTLFRFEEVRWGEYSNRTMSSQGWLISARRLNEAAIAGFPYDCGYVPSFRPLSEGCGNYFVSSCCGDSVANKIGYGTTRWVADEYVPGRPSTYICYLDSFVHAPEIEQLEHLAKLYCKLRR